MHNYHTQILTAKKQPPSSPFSKGEFKEADTAALEKQIDEMVYKLYGLTCLQATHRQAPEEIALVEGKGQLNIDIAEKNIF